MNFVSAYKDEFFEMLNKSELFKSVASVSMASSAIGGLMYFFFTNNFTAVPGVISVETYGPILVAVGAFGMFYVCVSISISIIIKLAFGKLRNDKNDNAVD